MTSYTAQTLADWALGLDFKHVGDDVVEKAEDCVLDAIGCAIAGKCADGAARIERVAKTEYREGPADLWFGGGHLHPTGAAFVNSAAASILDIDDGHRGATGHPGAAVVPSALAIAQQTGASGSDILAAIIAGYEVCVRVGGSEKRRAYHTGNWTGFGAATVAARLHGLNAAQLGHALTITAYHGPRVADLTLSKDMGANVKESIPWSVVTGLNAAGLAAEGFSGCRDALDIDERFEPNVATAGLGNGFQIMGTYFKRYSACRWVHAAVEALLQIMTEHRLKPEDIENVRVETFLQAASLNNLADPPTPESAQYSIPYCLGIAATKGDAALMPMVPGDLHDARAIAFAKAVSVVCDDRLAERFPKDVPSRVIVTSNKGTLSTTVDVPWGEPGDPDSRVKLAAKFRSLVSERVNIDIAERLLAAIEMLKSGAVEPLFGLLTEPLLPVPGEEG